MKLFLCLGLLALAGAVPAATVWQLGVADDSSCEFAYQYRAWEYGRAPYLKNLAAMDPATGTFTYMIAGNEVIVNPAMVSSINTPSIAQFMPKEEIVSGLRLVWREKTDGNRKLVFRTADWSNEHLGQNGILLLLPGGRRVVFNLPAGSQKTAGLQEYSAVFPVNAGVNELTLKIVTRAKHYRLSFDYLKLEIAEAPAVLTPVAELKLNDESNIFTVGVPAGCTVKLYNLEAGYGEYFIRDFWGKTVGSGSVEVRNGEATFGLPTQVRGYYQIEFKLGGTAATTSYAVLEAVTPEWKVDSRFGCHAYYGDNYAATLMVWDEARARLKARRAAAAGARWARYHLVNWALREPVRGQYDWRGMDERLALMEQYKIYSLWNVVYVPGWNSPSEDSKLTVCGEQQRFTYAPKDFTAWAEFLRQLASRYRGRVQWYELGNEPGYASAFWGSGSPQEFAQMLQYGYEAVKTADPAAKVLSGAPLSIGFFEEVLQTNDNQTYFDLMSIHYPGNSRRGSENITNWRAMLAARNIHTPIVNSEDMSWRNGKVTDAEIAANVVQSYVRDAAQGVVKTFGFQMFDDNSNSRYSFFDLNDAPYPAYAAYRAMTHRLEDATYAGNLSGADFEAYLFDRKGTPVLVFWSDKDMELSFDLGAAPQALVSLMDTELPLVAADGKVKVKAANFPQFIEGGDGNFLTQLADAVRSLPVRLTVRPGQSVNFSGLPPSVKIIAVTVPDNWTATRSTDWRIGAPAKAEPGLYDALLTLQVDGREVNRNLVLELLPGEPGENLLRNGDFKDGTNFWFFPKTPQAFELVAGADGAAAVKIKGNCFFGAAGAAKVRAGERYLLSYKVKGDGTIGFAYSLLDNDAKTVFPLKPGINGAFVKVADSGWVTKSEVIAINTPGAEWLKIGLLANHQLPEAQIEVTCISVVRLEGNMSANKALCRGVFAPAPADIKIDGDPAKWANVPGMKIAGRANVTLSPKVSWQGPDDLSGECKLMLGNGKLYFAFFVRDDVIAPGIESAADSWQQDSIQIGIDPLNEGKYATEIILCRDRQNRPAVYKIANFWTPELPGNLTRRGVIAGAEMVIVPSAGGLFYEGSIPLAELYPLKGDAQSFGWSWLVNDNDGGGRKYIEWSSGIGGGKDAAQYGTVKRQKMP